MILELYGPKEKSPEDTDTSHENLVSSPQVGANADTPVNLEEGDDDESMLTFSQSKDVLTPMSQETQMSLLPKDAANMTDDEIVAIQGQLQCKYFFIFLYLT